MSAVSAPGADLPGEPVRRWMPSDPARALGCGRLHDGPGTLDESERRLSHTELAAAMALVGDGHSVSSLEETPGAGRRADLLACGEPVEVKGWERRRTGAPTHESVANKLTRAVGQARHVVLVAGDSRLGEEALRRGIAEFEARRPGRLDSVRALGGDFEVAWRSEEARSLGSSGSRPQPGRARRPETPDPDRGLGL